MIIPALTPAAKYSRSKYSFTPLPAIDAISVGFPLSIPSARGLIDMLAFAISCPGPIYNSASWNTLSPILAFAASLAKAPDHVLAMLEMVW